MDEINREQECLDEAFFVDKDLGNMIDKWVTSTDSILKKQKFKSSNVSDKEYALFTSLLKIMRDQNNDYAEYKKAFDKFCTLCHFTPKGVVITKTELKRGEEDRNFVEVEYAFNTKKIKLPEGTKLYHISKVPGIKALEPQFRGKSERGYLYDKPRIYFTIRKNMPKFLADYKSSEKMYKYVASPNITEVYVDPLVSLKAQGAVYIETNKPIPIRDASQDSITTNDMTANKSVKLAPDNIKESGGYFDMESFLEFVIENEFEIVSE